MKEKCKMSTEKPDMMDARAMKELRGIILAPYMQLSTYLIGKSRHAGGNMFRHQFDTLAVLIDYGYIDAVLLKAALIHDVVEDIAGFNVNEIINCDEDGKDVYKLVLEVTRREGETKGVFLQRIINEGSQKSKILKCADRISNMISLGFVTEKEFIDRYCDETEYYVLPIALEVNYHMYRELISLIISRRKYLEEWGYINQNKTLSEEGEQK